MISQPDRPESPAASDRPVEQLELVPSPPRLSVCRVCRRSIIWTRTERDKKMPLDSDPVADHDQAGLFVLRETERRDGPLAIAAWGLNGLEPHYRCHFDTCSDSGRSRSSQMSELKGSTWESAFGPKDAATILQEMRDERFDSIVGRDGE